MSDTARNHSPRLPAGCRLAPIHAAPEGAPLVICILTHLHADPAGSSFLMLRELPGGRVYAGAVCDAEARIQEWVEIWVQTLEIQQLEFSGYETQLSNLFFDQGWLAESQRLKNQLPEHYISVQMEAHNAGPILIKHPAAGAAEKFAAIAATGWRVCTEDAVLEAHGLPPYSGSPFRYLHEPAVRENKTFLSGWPETPASSHVQSAERLREAPGVAAVFNPEGGFVRVTRHAPLGLEDYLQILEGKPWPETVGSPGNGFPSGHYAALRQWSANPKGLPFLLHGDGSLSDRLNEIFFLKLSAVFAVFNEVRRLVQAHQLPLLNLTPASFQVALPETGEQFPALWSAVCRLAKPGQAYPLKIKSTEQRYFIRLGRIEPSPFLPEGMGAHSFGIGNVQIRNVIAGADGVVLEGTLVAEDYLGLDPHDLLWFKLPLADERMEFHAHVYKTDAGGPREARFRTVPARLPESTVAALKRTAGTRFPKSPYEIWPLLSSPCDLYSLGVMTARILLGHSESNLPVILDELLSLARRLGEATKDKHDHLAGLKALLGSDENLSNLTSPHSLLGGRVSPAEARAAVSTDIWVETVSWLLRLFPDTGTSSFCRDFGDVTPLALETVFDQPLQEVQTILLRLRSILAPSLAENQEISAVILEQLSMS